jgi:chromosome partitioning protein
MASIVAVLNMKGGTGKSTVATNLARGLQRAQGGRRGGAESVCIVDADPQGTALRWDNAKPEDADMPPVLSVSLPLNKRIPAVADGWEFVVVDGAAKAKDRTRQCVEVADVVLIPIRPSGADLWASEWLVSVVKARRRQTGGVPAAAFLVSQQIVGTNLAGEIEDVFDRYDLPVLGGRTSQRVAYAEALSVGSTVLDTAPGSKAATEVQKITAGTLDLLNDTTDTDGDS